LPKKIVYFSFYFSLKIVMFFCRLCIDNGRDKFEEIVRIMKMEKMKLIMVIGWMM